MMKGAPAASVAVALGLGGLHRPFLPPRRHPILCRRRPARKDPVRLRPRPGRHRQTVPQPARQARTVPRKPSSPFRPDLLVGCECVALLVLAGRHLPRAEHPLRPRPRLGHQGRPRSQDQVRRPRRRGPRPPPPRRQLPPGLRLPARAARTPRPAPHPPATRPPAGRTRTATSTPSAANSTSTPSARDVKYKSRSGTPSPPTSPTRTPAAGSRPGSTCSARSTPRSAASSATSRWPPRNTTRPSSPRCRPSPGSAAILSLTILLEIDTVTRFDSRQQFCSYARLITPKQESAGKVVGVGNARAGNAWLKWAFSEAAVLECPEGRSPSAPCCND